MEQEYPTYKTLNTGAKMPIIGLGTGGTVDETKDLIKTGIVDAGFRHIDTASIYGNGKQIGEALQEIFTGPSGIKREDIFISTKLWFTEISNPEEALRKQLKDLQVDYIDLYLVHMPMTNQISKEGEPLEFEKIPLHKTWKELEKLVRAGLTRHIGLSNFNVQLTLDLLTYAEIKPVVNQIEVHPYFVRYDLVEFMKKLGIVVVAYSPLTSKGAVFFTPTTKSIFEEQVVKELAEKYQKTPTQIILNWHLQRGHVPIPKSKSLHHLKENLASTSFKLSKEEVDAISALNSNESIVNFAEFAYTFKIPLLS